MERVKFRKVALLLLFVMLLNSVAVLAGVKAAGEEKLKVKISFDIVGEKGTLIGEDKQAVDLEIDSNGEISQNDILTNDAILFDLPTDIFVIREQNVDKNETNEEYKAYIASEKKKNTGKLYYIDVKRVREIWSKAFVNFDSIEGQKIKFRIDGKKFDSSAQEYVEDIVFNLGNRAILKNEYFVDTKSDEKYNKNNKNLVSIMGYYNEAGSNLYRKDIRENKIPRANMTTEELKKFLDKKENLLHEFKDNHNFNLVGYTITGGYLYNWSGTNDDKVAKIAESEYELIKLIGIDRFVFLKSNKDFRGLVRQTNTENPYIYNYKKDYDVKYENINDYKFTYEFEKDQMTIGYIENLGNLSKTGMTKAEESQIKELLKNWNVRVGKVTKENIEEDGVATKNIKEIYTFIDDEDEKVKLLYNLMKEEIGSNITNEILMGTFNENKVKADNNEERPKLENEKEQLDRAVTKLETKLNNVEVGSIFYSKDGFDQGKNLIKNDEKIIPFSINMAERFETSRHYEYRKEIIDNYYLEMKTSGILKNKLPIENAIDRISDEQKKLTESEIKLEAEKTNLEKLKEKAKVVVDEETIDFDLDLISKLAKLEVPENAEGGAGVKNDIKKFDTVEKIKADENIDNVKKVGKINQEVEKANENIDKLNLLEDAKKLETLGEIAISIEELNIKIGDNTTGVNKEIKELNTKINDINTLLNDINGDITDSNSEIIRLEDQIQNSRDIIKAENNKIDQAVGNEDEDKKSRTDKEKEMFKDFAKYRGEVNYYVSEFLKLRTDMENAEADLENLDENATEEDREKAEAKFEDAKESLGKIEDELMKSLGELETIVATIKYYIVEVEKNDGKKDKADLDERMDALRIKRDRLKSRLEESIKNIRTDVKFVSGDFEKFISFDYPVIADVTKTNLDAVKTELKKYEGLDIKIDSVDYKLETESKHIIDLIDKLRLELEKPEAEQEDIDTKITAINTSISAFNTEKDKVKTKSNEVANQDIEIYKADGSKENVNVKDLLEETKKSLDDLEKIIYKENERIFTIDSISSETYDPGKVIKNDDLANGVNFQLVYRPSKNNDTDGDKLENIEDFNRIPWIKYEKIEREDLDPDERTTDKYDYINIEHIGGYYKNGNGELSSESQRYGNYWMFNPNISGDASKAKTMKVKTPKDLKLLINMDSIIGELEAKTPFPDGYAFDMKLAYVKLDSESGTDFIFRNELVDKKAKDGDIFTLKDGNLYIYQNSKDKLVDLKDPKASEIADEDIKKLTKITLVFEDELNREYTVKYQDNTGKDILDPVVIKGLIGTTFSVNAPDTIVIKEEVKNEDGTVAYKYTKYSNPDKTSQKITLNDNGTVIVFRYSKKEASNEDEFKKNKLIPGYELKDDKLEKIGEKTNKEEDSKNHQSKQNEGQVKLNIRYQGLQVCKVPNCSEHKTLASKYRKYTPNTSRNKIHSQMFINKDETINVKIKPFADKYGRNKLDGYGIDDNYPPYQVSIKDDISNLSIDITKEDIGGKAETTLNLYEYFAMPHNGVKDFDYKIGHNIYHREKPEDSYGDKPLYKANISIPFRTNSQGHLNAPTMSFTNLIFKMWDKYGDFAQHKNDPTKNENRSFDKLAIRKLNKNLEEEVIVVVEHDGNLKAKELQPVGGATNHYKFNFTLIEKEQWYRYIYQVEEVQEKLDLYTTVKPNTNENDHRDIIFDYYFTGNPKPTEPNLKTADYTVKYLDQDGRAIFPEYVQALEIGTILKIKETRQNFDDYILFKTNPNKEELEIQEDESKNIIEHYYYNKNTHTQVNYYANGGSFGNGNINDITNPEKTERKVIAKLGGLLKPYNPADIYRSGYNFKGWTLGSPTGELVSDDRLVEKELKLYAKWEKRTDSTITFHSNGGEFNDNSTIKTVTGRPGNKVGDYTPSVRRSGYSLDKWTLESSGGQAATDRILKEGEHLDVYAQWNKDSNGGGGGDKPDPIKPKPEPEPSKPTDRKGREIGKVLEPKIEYELNKQDHFAYVKGYKDNTVQPNGYITREEVAMVFYRLMETEYREEIETTNHKFNDVKANSWSTKAISTLANGELLKGYPDGSFKPQGKMTRGEISKVIARFTDTIVLETQMPDVINHWAEDYINTVENKGWVKGYEDGTFRPNELLTRAEFVTMVNSLLDRKVKQENILPGVKTFKDLDMTKWYYEQITESVNGHDYELERLVDGTEKWIKLVDTQYPD